MTVLAEHADKLAEYQQALFDDLRVTFQTLQNQDDSAPLRIADLPPALRDRFVGVNGKFLLQVYPKKNVWQRDNQKEFVDALRQALDPHNTNHPDHHRHAGAVAGIHDAAQEQLYHGGVVFAHRHRHHGVFPFPQPGGGGSGADSRGHRHAVAGRPDGLAESCPFNPANIMTLPLVIGIGVTNGIHILNRYAEEGTPGILARSTGKAVLVSGLTAIAGFGSLILAQHRGIHSLGLHHVRRHRDCA